MGPKKKTQAPSRVGDPYSKLLHRFYEPLILSKVLGRTRGTHTSAPQDNGDDQRRCRRLLRNLSYLCDYDKGGDTTSSIALEDSEQCYVFWIASNATRTGNKIVEFLESSLAKVYRIVTTTEDQRRSLEAEFTRACIDFAKSRVKNEVNLLSGAARKCKAHIDNEDRGADSRLANWLEQFISIKEKPIADACLQAYNQRKAPESRLLEDRTYTGNGDTSFYKHASPFTDVRHRLGRLAHHIRAPKEIIEDSLELVHLFDVYKVRLVKPPASNSPPCADSLTKLDGILKRMLPANDPRLDEYTEASVSLDHRFQITQRIRKQYGSKSFKPRVHAEIQILEHFCAKQLRYVDNDRYIGCSKPACYCCYLYFSHHNSMPVKPESHQKIYLNWGLPALPNGSDDPGYIPQRDLMNKMLETIRKDALAQIIRQAGPLTSHPDSLTGITVSTKAFPVDIARSGESSLDIQLKNLGYDLDALEITPTAESPDTVEESSSSSFDYDNLASCEPQDETVDGSESDSDSDSDGGVFL
ncbi:hypothetical protein F5Y11DRAFT_334117 [Daldinia sp. FL1419]|nr:hypothetical protein F5Y11DRAFT_334117 [Daldinia sp. FL1419]